ELVMYDDEFVRIEVRYAFPSDPSPPPNLRRVRHELQELWWSREDWVPVPPLVCVTIDESRPLDVHARNQPDDIRDLSVSSKRILYRIRDSVEQVVAVSALASLCESARQRQNARRFDPAVLPVDVHTDHRKGPHHNRIRESALLCEVERLLRIEQPLLIVVHEVLCAPTWLSLSIRVVLYKSQ